MKNTSKTYYLDTSAHTPMCEPALKAFVDYNRSVAGHGNPNSPNLAGREAAVALEEARGKIAGLLGVDRPSQLIFTSTATYAAEWSVHILKNIKNNGEKIKVSPVEHPAIAYCTREFEKLPIDENGVIKDCEVDKAICMHVQNEIGVIQPLERIKKKILLSDMCQSIGKIPINLKEMPADLAIIGAHKFMGPASIGILYLRDTDWWKEFGQGSRYFLDRNGSMDVASVVATAAALENELKTMPERLEKCREFQMTLEKGLEELGIEVIGKEANRVPNITFMYMPKIATQVLLALSNEGIYCGLGSSCGSLSSGKTVLLKALNHEGESGDFIRISHREYSASDAKYILNRLEYYTKLYRKK